MNIRIADCSKKDYWYYDKINEVMEVENFVKFDGWFSVVGSNQCIKINDCVVLDAVDLPSPSDLAEQISTLSKQINELSQQLKQALQS